MKQGIKKDLSFGGPYFFKKKFFKDCSRIKGSLAPSRLETTSDETKTNK